MGNEQSSTNTIDIKLNYEFLEVLGKGSYATVFKAKNIKTLEYYAIKVIRKRDLNSIELENIHDEVSILQSIDHPNIVKLYEIYETEQKVYLVLELLEGGELFDRIINKTSFSENEAMNIIRDVTNAISYLHQRGIVHRDLKPENLLFKSDAPDAPIKITDFGLAKYCSASGSSKNSNLTTSCGTPSYAAPEVIAHLVYGPKCDLWSIGVILYILLCGYPPFFSEEIPVLYHLILYSKHEYVDPFWTHISKEAKTLIDGLLLKDPELRFDINDILESDWMDPLHLHLKSSKLNVSEKMKHARANSKLHKTFKAVMATERLKNLLLIHKSTGISPMHSPEISSLSSPASPLNLGIAKPRSFALCASLNLPFSLNAKPSPRESVTSSNGREALAASNIDLASPLSFRSSTSIIFEFHDDKIMALKVSLEQKSPIRTKSVHVASPTSPSYDNPLTEFEIEEENKRKLSLNRLSIRAGADRATLSTTTKYDF